MKRRGFLAMFGAAVAAPTLPFAAGTPSRAVAGLAAAHAKTYPFVSVVGLSKRIGVSMAEAESILLELSRKGLVGPVNNGANGPVCAKSTAFQPDAVLVRAREARQAAKRTQKEEMLRAKAAREQQSFQVDLRHMLTHLHGLCVDQGLTLHPSARRMVA